MSIPSVVRRKFAPWLAFLPVLAIMVVVLRAMGRTWWCACGRLAPWAGDIWSAHCSQHFFDPYSFTHILHGVVFSGWIWLAARRLRPAWQLALAVTIEAGWEILENSPWIIQRYREATIGLGYVGDAIANSFGDIACCAAGFILARFLGLRRSVLLFVAIELLLLIVVRDNLTLNVLMLICPIEAIKSWQMVR